MFVTAAVPKSSHYGFFGIIKHKLGLSGRHKSRAGQLQVQYRCTEPVITVQLQEEVSLASSGSWENRVLESPQVRIVTMLVMIMIMMMGPQVVRIRCEEGVEDIPPSPIVIRRKVR